MQENFIPNAASGNNFMKSVKLKHLSRKRIVELTYVIFSSFRLNFVSNIWNMNEMTVIQKQGVTI